MKSTDTKNTQAAQAMTSGIIEEIKRVTWPTKDETIRLTVVVIAISLIIAFYVGIIDVLLAKLLDIVA